MFVTPAGGWLKQALFIITGEAPTDGTRQHTAIAGRSGFAQKMPRVPE